MAWISAVIAAMSTGSGAGGGGALQPVKRRNRLLMVRTGTRVRVLMLQVGFGGCPTGIPKVIISTGSIQPIVLVV